MRRQCGARWSACVTGSRSFQDCHCSIVPGFRLSPEKNALSFVHMSRKSNWSSPAIIVLSKLKVFDYFFGHKQATMPCHRPSRSTICSTKFLTTFASARPLLCFMTYPIILLSTFLFPARNEATSLGRAWIAASQSNCNSELGEDEDVADESGILLESAVSWSSLASWVGVCEVGFVNMCLRRNFPDVPVKRLFVNKDMKSEVR